MVRSKIDRGPLQWRAWFQTRIRTLSPAYFSVVMATGILSVGSELNGWRVVSNFFLVLSFIFFISFLLLYGFRWIRFASYMRADFIHPERSFGFLTLVAATDVLAIRLNGTHELWLMVLLALMGLLSWMALLYMQFAYLIFENVRPIAEVVNGSWLLAPVATQSLAIVGTLVATHTGEEREWILVASFALWALGILFYLLFIVFILYRFFFCGVRQEDLAPSYWINMGAMAIATVAGAHLASPDLESSFLRLVHSFVVALTVMMWAWGSWWFPLLLIMGGWKYRSLRKLLHYETGLWSIIFPLGMYAVSLFFISQFPGLHFLSRFVATFLIFAIVAWCFTLLLWGSATAQALKRLFQSGH
ncbi:tellurite resistance/C4-dicarboxylate transporter family protein [Ferroacidibacillus organovorans]|uniref:tellurite resistance/C4-dicarboxylate transporter family protein n=1 Tax=Ferroacidibacillus organovorans TaxID=1765683 RepID=UPI001365C7B5|nr:tellurite resistance/C4-dicarboxylate transporter family protein [Ferroacidibacillus organovorans]